MMFESLVENNNEVNLEKDDVQMIKDLIKGEIHESYEKSIIYYKGFYILKELFKRMDF